MGCPGIALNDQLGYPPTLTDADPTARALALAARGFPTASDSAFPGERNINDSLKTFLKEGCLCRSPAGRVVGGLDDLVGYFVVQLGRSSAVQRRVAWSVPTWRARRIIHATILHKLQGGKVYCCCFGLSLHGAREEDLLEGVIPPHPLDVQKALIYYARFNYRDYRTRWEKRAAELGVQPVVLGPVAHDELPALVAATGVFCWLGSPN